MYNKIIINFLFKDKKNTSYKDVSEIEYILFLLYRTGRILHERIIEETLDGIIVTLVAIDEEKFFKTFNKFKKVFDDKYEIEFFKGEQISATTKICNCDEPTFYVINPDYDFINNACCSSLLQCGECGNQVPWIGIVDIDGDECSKVVDFQEMYESLEKLRLKSNCLEFVEKEILDCNSIYNKLGLKIRGMLEEVLNKPVYYFIKNPIDGVEGPEKVNLEYCPICNEKLIEINKNSKNKRKSFWINKKCEKCKIVVPTYE